MRFSKTSKWIISILLAAVLFCSPAAARAAEVSAPLTEAASDSSAQAENESTAAGNPDGATVNDTDSENIGADAADTAGANIPEATQTEEVLSSDENGNADDSGETGEAEAADGTGNAGEAEASDGTGNTDAGSADENGNTDGESDAGSADGTVIPDAAGEQSGEAVLPDGDILPDGTSVEESILVPGDEEGILAEEVTRVDAGLKDGIYTISTALNTSRVLDVPGASQKNSVQLQIYDDNDSMAQQFFVKNLGNGMYSLENCSSGKVLDAAKGKHVNGTVVQQYKFNNGKHQKWYILTSGKSGYYSIASALDKTMVLDVTGGKNANKTKIQLYKYDDSSKQLWKFRMRNPAIQVADGAYILTSAASSSRVLEVKDGSKANGGNVQIGKSGGTDAQKFYFEAVGDGFYEITNQNSGRAVDIKSGSRKEGMNVQQYDPNRTAAQKWRIFEAANDTYIFYSGLGGRVLTVDGSTDAGTNVYSGVYKRSNYQRFTLKRVSGSKTKPAGTGLTATPTPTPQDTGTTVTEAEGLYTIHALVGGLTMVEVADGSFEKSADVQIVADNDKNWQKWYLVKKGDWYQICSAQSGMNLDVKGGKNVNSTNVQQYSKNSTDAQLWKFVSTGDKDGSVYIVSKLGKYLDVRGGNPSYGTNIQIYESNKTKSQKFILTKTTIADGWTTDVNGKEYYYLNGRKVTGWNRIGSYNYYFYSDGRLAKNTTIDGFLVDEMGRRYGVKISTRPKTLYHKKTILSLLRNAMVPCGRVLYIWGGGHEAPVADGYAGYPDFWDDFYVTHAFDDYDRHDYEYKQQAGLDCSGYVAWTVYNTLYSESGKEWMAYATSEMKNYYLNKGYANPDYIDFKAATATTLPGVLYPGDLCIMAGHVMICLGRCSDGSVVFIHSAPSDGTGGGVQISGTKRPVKTTVDGTTKIEWKSDSQAVALAQKYMSKYFPEWPYGTRAALGSEYMRFAYGRIHWKTDVLTDPEGVIKMKANEVLELLLGPA